MELRPNVMGVPIYEHPEVKLEQQGRGIMTPITDHEIGELLEESKKDKDIDFVLAVVADAGELIMPRILLMARGSRRSKKRRVYKCISPGYGAGQKVLHIRDGKVHTVADAKTGESLYSAGR